MSTTPKGLPAPQKFKPTDDRVVTFLQERAVFGETVRFKTLDRREAFFRCKAYAHQQKDWWGRDADQQETISPEAVFPPGTTAAGGNEEVLVRDKRPTAPTNIARTVVRRYTGLLFSKSRRPEIKVEQDPDTEAFLKAVRDSCRFWPMMRAARNKGGAMGSVVMTVGLREGKFSYDVHNAKNVTPLWRDKRSLQLQGILVMWRYNKEVNTYDKDGKFAGTSVVVYLHRRIITEHTDITYVDVRLDDANESNWIEQARVDHGLGFFPGVWIQNEAETDDVDGDADCEGAWQTIDTNDRLIAQMNKGLLKNLDPTTVTKTDEKEIARIEASAGQALQKGSDYALEVGPSGDAKYMEMEGAGITVGMAFSKELKQTVSDITGAVFLSEKDLGSDQSGKAMEYRYAPMIDRADDFRAQYGDAIVELMTITERIARLFLGTIVAVGPNETPSTFRFKLPMRKIREENDGVVVDRLVPHKLGPGGYISLEWGPYFSPTEDDKQKTIKNATAANAGGLIDKVTAARTVAPFYGVTDVEGTVAKAKEELEAEVAAGLAGAGGGVFPGDPNAAAA